MTIELRSLLERRTRTASATTKPMRSLKVTTVTPYVFGVERRDRKTGQTITAPIGDLKKSWKTACYKAGIPCTVEPVKKGGKRGAVKVIACSRTFHDLRRSAAKNLIAQGIPERVVMEMCGWITRSVFDRYSIVGQADLVAARERMNEAKRATNGARSIGPNRETQ